MLRVKETCDAFNKFVGFTKAEIQPSYWSTKLPRHVAMHIDKEWLDIDKEWLDLSKTKSTIANDESKIKSWELCKGWTLRVNFLFFQPNYKGIYSDKV